VNAGWDRNRFGARAKLASAFVAAICGGLFAAPSSASAAVCPPDEISTSSGCRTLAQAGRQVEAMVAEALAADDLRAVLLRIDRGDRTIAATSPGESMAGAPANLRMHFRIGSMAIPFVIDLLLQLDDRGKLSLDDPLAKYLPEYPNADRVTLRYLGNSISGYPDWIQGNDAFQETLLNDVFKQWTTEELLDAAFAQPLICDPGACFHYAHTNFAILGRVIREVTGQSVERLMRTRILKPLRLRHTRISALPNIPEPVLHAYVADRGPYEDSTYWSPSWGLPKAQLLTSTIPDLIKSAKAIGTGALISRKAARERVAPTAANLPPFTPSLYYGLGIVVANTWMIQNPVFNGYKGILAYLPDRKISLALMVTSGPNAAASSTNYSEKLLSQITQFLTPGHPVVFPGG
jgi:CubicO group peptidase (beta-lactamase class C family)